ncbi:MAG: hypothetical protein ACKODX_14180 [Gemmata sp.]
MMRSIWCAVLCVATLALAGCGTAAAPKYSVGGTVTHGGEKLTWPDGGSLLVVFMEPAPGTGRYPARDTDVTASTYTVSGIPPGRYLVAVQQFRPSEKTNFNDALGGRYDPGHTDLTVEVAHDGQVINIDMPKAPANAKKGRRSGGTGD